MDYSKLTVAQLEAELDRRDALRLAGEAYGRAETKEIMAVRNAKLREENARARADAAQLVADGLAAREARRAGAQTLKLEPAAVGTQAAGHRGG